MSSTTLLAWCVSSSNGLLPFNLNTSVRLYTHHSTGRPVIPFTTALDLAQELVGLALCAVAAVVVLNWLVRLTGTTVQDELL